jgi:acetate---CoA ligase (ADP-forming)
VLASGYREVGETGLAQQHQLADRAAAHGITLLGPNCLGFLNAHAHAGPFALTVPLPLAAGPVGIALQSGALASAVLAFARARAIGVSTLVTLGNEAMVTATDVLEYLIADEHTRAICMFLEEIGEPGKFAQAAVRADQAGKPIVVMKAGSSQAGRDSALAHTGAVAGNDAVVDAALRQLNVIRVSSLEQMLSTGSLLGYGRVPSGRRMGVLTSSGGACDIIADLAASEGIEIPAFAPPTADAISAHLPPFAQPRNPLDATGYFLANQRTSVLTPVDHALDAVADDPGLDFVLFSGISLPDTRMPDEKAAAAIEDRFAWIGQRIASAPIPVIPVGLTGVDVSQYGREVFGRSGIHPLAGMELGVRAIGNALRWAEGRGRARAWRETITALDVTTTTARSCCPDNSAGPSLFQAAGPRTAVLPPEAPWPEDAARKLIASAGVPVVPGELVRSADPDTGADAAVAAAEQLGYPVVLRVCSAQITHKSDVGAVALDLRTPDQLRHAYARVRAAAEAVPGAVIDGIMISPMRMGGVELLAGVTVDPSFGAVLAVGLGGIWVEALNDVSLRLLPVDADDVVVMLGELRGASLLRGARGRRPADLGAIGRAISALGDAALALGNSLHSVEINPLWVDGDVVEALDVLVITHASSDIEENG